MSAHSEQVPQLIGGDLTGDGATVLEVGPEAAGQRLDQWLAGKLGFSRNRVQGLIRQGAVCVEGKPHGEGKRKIAPGERVSVELPDNEPVAPVGEAMALDILYEDADLIVVNKPAGLVVHPGAGNWSGTLVNGLIHHCGANLSHLGGVWRPGIVHRIDKQTSGVLVVAKTDLAYTALSEAFADHGRTGDLERAYAALVWGMPSRGRGTVDAPLGRAADRVRRAVVPETREDARHAVTHFSVEERFGQGQDGGVTASLIECRLETGRTHQIRVHMAHIGHPVVGDPEYGRAFASKANRLPTLLREKVRAFPRQALHARLLEFRHPGTHITMRFEAPLPPDMEELVEGFRAL